MNKSTIILSGGADTSEVLNLITNDVQSNYYTHKDDLLDNETDVKENDIRQFKITISVEEIK